MVKINRISPDKHKYLQGVCSIAKPPEKLYFIGTIPQERVPTVAIVGTRKPTAYGQEVTRRIAYDLASRGVVIMSGLALGIDGLAHRAALEANGTTIAVIPGGLPHVQPSSHQGLADQIISHGGAVLCEHGPDYEIKRWSFVERNRLLSGLADAIIITEATSKSGTLNTAMHALEQGREVFVVPGNITSPASAGCNLLLKQGALPITSADDVLEVIAPQLLRTNAHQALGANELETRIIELIGQGVSDIDDLLLQIDAEASELNVSLTMLEISGAIVSLGAGKWAIR